MSDDIQPIPTNYRGIHFRSRIEARWAVFYDAMGIRYEYEPEGYAADGIAYLPDFWLPDHQVFVEIKGAYPKPDEIHKAEMLAGVKYHAVFIFYGGIPESPHKQGNDSALCVGPAGVIDSQYWWCECAYCGGIGIQWQGHADRLPCVCHVNLSSSACQRDDTPRLLTAYEAARSADFGAPRRKGQGHG